MVGLDITAIQTCFLNHIQRQFINKIKTFSLPNAKMNILRLNYGWANHGPFVALGELSIWPTGATSLQ